MKIYLDNAATTPLDPLVFSAMTPFLLNSFGNPSSLHQHGREARAVIDQSRKTIANLIKASPEEIIFTSGGTEADNIAILSAVKHEGIKHVITTKLEHHAVLNILKDLEAQGAIQVSFINNDHNGNLDVAGLELLLKTKPRSLVSVMHANNEIGTRYDIEAIAGLCDKYNGLFHTDTVQTMGHYHFDLRQLKIHYLTASGHKFHGPKGTGFLFFRKGLKPVQLIKGGGQENNWRAGTENIAGIAGIAKALEIACTNIIHDQQYIGSLKNRLISRLRESIPEIRFNGNPEHWDKNLYTVLSVNFPSPGLRQGLMNYLDQSGISVSGGSACSAGKASHVLEAIGVEVGYETIRFSFSKFNTLAEIDQVTNTLASIYNLQAA